MSAKLNIFCTNSCLACSVPGLPCLSQSEGPSIQAGASSGGDVVLRNPRYRVAYRYLCALFAGLPKATCLEDYEALLPWRIALATK